MSHGRECTDAGKVNKNSDLSRVMSVLQHTRLHSSHKPCISRGTGSSEGWYVTEGTSALAHLSMPAPTKSARRASALVRLHVSVIIKVTEKSRRMEREASGKHKSPDSGPSRARYQLCHSQHCLHVKPDSQPRSHCNDDPVSSDVSTRSLPSTFFPLRHLVEPAYHGVSTA